MPAWAVRTGRILRQAGGRARTGHELATPRVAASPWKPKAWKGDDPSRFTPRVPGLYCAAPRPHHRQRLAPRVQRPGWNPSPCWGGDQPGLSARSADARLLKPVIVTSHLLGGMSTLALLALIVAARAAAPTDSLSPVESSPSWPRQACWPWIALPAAGSAVAATILRRLSHLLEPSDQAVPPRLHHPWTADSAARPAAGFSRPPPSPPPLDPPAVRRRRAWASSGAFEPSACYAGTGPQAQHYLYLATDLPECIVLLQLPCHRGGPQHRPHYCLCAIAGWRPGRS